jgi:type IV pilus assembly protein PilC
LNKKMNESVAAQPHSLTTVSAAPPSAVPLSATPLPGQTVGVFYGQLAGLLKAGMPLPNALRTLSSEAGRPQFRAALERAAAAIEKGSSPEDAFRGEDRELGGILGRVAGASAAAGQLPGLLAELSAWTLNQDRIRRKIADALLYPYSVLILACILGLTFLTLAQVFNLFQGMGVDEWGTVNSAAGQFLFPYFPPQAAQAFIGCVLAACGFLPLAGVLGRINPDVRRWRERLMIRLPVVSSVCRPLALSRFCGCVAILMKSGRPYHEAVAAAGPLTGYAPYVDAAYSASEKLRAGAPHADAWANPRLFPASMRFILASAEARGDLPDAFAQLSELYQVEAEGRGRIITVLAPPVFLVGVGVVVSVMLFGLLNPLIRIMEVLGR